MKLKFILSTFVLTCAFASINAHAACALDVSPSGYIARGQAFSYLLSISDFGPFPPNPYYTVKFFGTKNGVADIPSTGEPYPGIYGHGGFDLSGFANPLSGGFSGYYVRYAVLYDTNGQVWCTTNPIPVILE
jgi:hypothetical protein